MPGVVFVVLTVKVISFAPKKRDRLRVAAPLTLFGTRELIWVVRRIDERLPGGITNRVWICVVVPEADGRERSRSYMSS